jgi:hypothetical protein
MTLWTGIFRRREMSRQAADQVAHHDPAAHPKRRVKIRTVGRFRANPRRRKVENPPTNPMKRITSG